MSPRCKPYTPFTQKFGHSPSDVESLASYFCRLAASHSVSVASLACTVAEALGSELREGFDWHERNLSGMRETAQTWAGGLSAMTGVGRLDQLTLVAWRDVLAPSGLAAAGGGRWCSDCFDEDRAQDRPPYFRLAWDIGAVKSCAKHGIRLIDVCPDCGRTGVRHRATYVVPGWCTHCGSFLGHHPEASSVTASPADIWVAEQIGQMLAGQGSLEEPPLRARLQETLRELVARLDSGKGALFAARIGVSKGTVHYWVHGETIPTMAACLRIAACSGLSLTRLLLGDLENWVVPREVVQLDLALDSRARCESRRELDWEHIRGQLRWYARQPTPISVAEAARRLEIDARHLYLKANTETRVLGERWKTYLKRRAASTQAKARPYVEAACRALMAEGRALNLREVQARVSPEILGSVERLFDMLQGIRLEIGAI